MEELQAKYDELQAKYDELMAITMHAIGHLVSLNGDLGSDGIREVIKDFEEFTGEEW